MRRDEPQLCHVHGGNSKDTEIQHIFGVPASAIGGLTLEVDQGK